MGVNVRPFLRDIHKIEEVTWDDGARWDIRIPDAPPPFNNWFPAAQVEVPEVTAINHTFEAGQMSFSIPKNLDQRSLVITFYDAVDRVLVDWLVKWIWEEIHNKGRGVTPVLDSVKAVEIVHLDEDFKPFEHRRFEVIPSGTLSTTLVSTPDPQLRSLEFNIINEV